MRILLFLGRLGGGGAQRQLLQLAEGARSRGHPTRLTVIEPGGRYWEEAVDAGLSTALWPDRARTRAGRAWRYATAFRRLRGAVRRFRADILYSALYPANLQAWLALRGEDAPPLVWGLRASDLPPRWPRELWVRLGAAVSGSVDLAIANSRAGLLHHRRRGYRPRSTAMVPNGIDTGRFRPDPDRRARVRREWGVAADEDLVGLVGRLDPMKGHEDFLEAAAVLRRQAPGVRFVCVGGGPAGYRRRLEARAQELGVGDRLLWAGERRDMPAVHSALDLLVLASRYGEGFPNVVGEAMACGTPCVVTDVGEAAEIVGSLGRVVPPGRPDRLGRAVAGLLRDGRDPDPAGGLRSGSSAALEDRSPAAGAERLRERIVSEYSLERFLERTLELLERAVTEAPA